MRKLILTTFAAAAVAISTSFAVEGTNSPYTDPAGDIDPGLNNGNGTLDILAMEVTNNATDITFTLTLNGDISTTDWGKFMIGISTGSTAITNTGNGWNRPIQLNSPIGGMDYWIGSWVDSGAGAERWSFDGVSWNNDGAVAGFSSLAGTNSSITITATLASLGLAPDLTFYFDAYSSGPGDTDSAVDALANPNVSITAWDQAYTSKTTDSGGPGLNSYKVVPEPSTLGLLGLAAAGLAGYALRRRTRK